MTPEQRQHLTNLLPRMRIVARRKVSPNDYQKAMHQADELVSFLASEAPEGRTAEEWISIAEKASEGHDKPGSIRMTMEQMLSGMPPEKILKKDE